MGAGNTGLPQSERLHLQPPPAPQLSPGPLRWPRLLLMNCSPYAIAFCFRNPNNLEIHLGTKGFQKNVTWAPAPLAATQWWCWLILQVTRLLRASLALLIRVCGLRLPKNAYRANKERSAAAQSCISTSHPSPNSADDLDSSWHFRYIPLPSLHFRTEIALCINGSPAPPTEKETKQSALSSAH